MKREIFQLIYIFMWLIMSIGIVGNMELGIKTPTISLIIYSVLSFLVAGKIIYWVIEGSKTNGEKKYY